MRDYLFRGQTKTNKWVYGSLIDMEPFSDPYIRIPPLGELVFVKPNTVGQYTGYTDINGTKIFEDDKLKIHDDGGYYKLPVYWNDGAFVVDYPSNNYDTTALGWLPSHVKLEIIGDIYEKTS